MFAHQFMGVQNRRPNAKKYRCLFSDILILNIILICSIFYIILYLSELILFYVVFKLFSYKNIVLMLTAFLLNVMDACTEQKKASKKTLLETGHYVNNLALNEKKIQVTVFSLWVISNILSRFSIIDLWISLHDRLISKMTGTCW